MPVQITHRLHQQCGKLLKEVLLDHRGDQRQVERHNAHKLTRDALDIVKPVSSYRQPNGTHVVKGEVCDAKGVGPCTKGNDVEGNLNLVVEMQFGRAFGIDDVEQTVTFATGSGDANEIGLKVPSMREELSSKINNIKLHFEEDKKNQKETKHQQTKKRVFYF
jgi:hypothetical protein